MSGSDTLMMMSEEQGAHNKALEPDELGAPRRSLQNHCPGPPLSLTVKTQGIGSQ